MVIGQQKGRDTKQNVFRNLGMPKPEGYRKAMRLMELAAKFSPAHHHAARHRRARIPASTPRSAARAKPSPTICAKCRAWAVPVIVVVIGEGGSGGALGSASAIAIYMLENAVYSVISPESCAAIIYRDSGRAPEAAAALKMTAPDLLQLGLIDGIVPEPGEGAHTDPDTRPPSRCASRCGSALAELSGLTPKQLIDDRYDKFRKMGSFFTEAVGAGR